jgi:deoxyribodipyrimidine photolyase-related protein
VTLAAACDLLVAELRCWVLVLGDQLDLDAAAFDGFDPQTDAAWMAEVLEDLPEFVLGADAPHGTASVAASRHRRERRWVR